MYIYITIIMPLRKRRRVATRRPRRRTYRRYRRTRKTLFSRLPAGVRHHTFAKLLYSDMLSAGVGGASSSTWGYQSSLYDPYAAAGGHQPLYFDQYTAMYNRYTVYGMAFDIEVSTDQSTNGPLFVTLTPSTTASSPTTLMIARERGGNRECNVSHGYKGRLRTYVSCAKLFGITNRQLTYDDQYSALYNADPARMVYMSVQVWNQTAAAISCYISMRIKYYCRFFDPKEPAQS